MLHTGGNSDPNVFKLKYLVNQLTKAGKAQHSALIN